MTTYAVICQHPIDDTRVSFVNIEAPDHDEATSRAFELLNSFYVTGCYLPPRSIDYSHPHHGQYIFHWLEGTATNMTQRLGTIEANNAQDAVDQLNALAAVGSLMAPATDTQ